VIGFILAAGFGTRLLPYSEHVPKALVPVCGVPLMKRVHDFLKTNQIEPIAINSHHHPQQVEDFVKSSFPATRIFHEQGKIRGTGGALFFAKDFLGTDDAFCVANVDILTNADIARPGRDFLSSGAVVGLVAAPSENGTIRYNEITREFTRTGLKRKQGTDTGLMHHGKSADFIGITFYRKEFLSLLSDNDFDIIPVWGRAQQKGMKVAVLEAGPVYWNDVGTPKNLAKIHFDVLDRKINLPLPGGMAVDYKGKKAYPESLGRESIGQLGSYSWIDAAALPEASAFSNAVVFADANVPDGLSIENAIVTKYGIMSFET
jgi:NDP-sugar pyrophosphorylase family protein